MRRMITLAAALAVSGVWTAAQAQDIESINYTDRNPETEYYFCLTSGHMNDRIVNNVEDARFCVDELVGRVELLPSSDVGKHMALSQIQCMQRNPLCKAPGT